MIKPAGEPIASEKLGFNIRKAGEGIKQAPPGRQIEQVLPEILGVNPHGVSVRCGQGPSRQKSQSPSGLPLSPMTIRCVVPDARPAWRAMRPDVARDRALSPLCAVEQTVSGRSTGCAVEFPIFSCTLAR